MQRCFSTPPRKFGHCFLITTQPIPSFAGTRVQIASSCRYPLICFNVDVTEPWCFERIEWSDLEKDSLTGTKWRQNHITETRGMKWNKSIWMDIDTDTFAILIPTHVFTIFLCMHRMDVLTRTLRGVASRCTMPLGY